MRRRRPARGAAQEPAGAGKGASHGPRGEPKHKASPRHGVDIYGTGGAPLARRLGVPPGGTRRGRRRLSEYALQLAEKQNARAYTGPIETQFRRSLGRARRQPGPPRENPLRLLKCNTGDFREAR